MEIKLKTVYELKKKSIPVIHNNIIHKDPGVGGTKLVYSTTMSLVREYKWRRITIYVPVFTSLLYKAKKTRIFLRPFKKDWDVKRNKLPRNFWGKPLHPLTNLWVELEYDYDNIGKSLPWIKKEIHDHSFEKILRHALNKFSIISNS